MDTINPRYKKVKALTDDEKSEVFKKLTSGDRYALSKSISWIESDLIQHLNQVKELLSSHKDAIDNSIRIGITGAPGAGKSTFIDSYGNFLVNKSNKVAVLAVDPSSQITLGSILADKTRMQRLSMNEEAFIRPSPSSLNLGGIRPNSLVSAKLCAVAGFDHIFIESVGVGQSETDISDICDIVIMLLQPGSGDEIQGIKKGIIEKSDVFIVHKADGNQITLANDKKQYIQNALKATQAKSKPVILYSSVLEENIEQIHQILKSKIGDLKQSGDFKGKRRSQYQIWVKKELERQIKEYFKEHPIFAGLLNELEENQNLHLPLDYVEKISHLLLQHFSY